MLKCVTNSNGMQLIFHRVTNKSERIFFLAASHLLKFVVSSRQLQCCKSWGRVKITFKSFADPDQTFHFWGGSAAFLHLVYFHSFILMKIVQEYIQRENIDIFSDICVFYIKNNTFILLIKNLCSGPLLFFIWVSSCAVRWLCIRTWLYKQMQVFNKMMHNWQYKDR